MFGFRVSCGVGFQHRFCNWCHIAQSISTRVEIGERLIPQLRDQNDVKILATAIVAEAQVLITGDLDLLVLHPFEAIEILTPSDFQRNYFGVDEQ
jgi:uncharacterized protein